MITLHKSSLKLASLYLAILMTISLLFSVSIYGTSIRELERGIRRPTNVMNTSPESGLPNQLRLRFQEERANAYEEAKERIIGNLVVVNIAILVAGGLLSYLLAVRTLKPIEDARAAQGRFAANASHELRTPITAMRVENEVAFMNPGLTLKDAKLQLQSNIEELEKLTSLSEGLLRLAQLEESTVNAEQVTVQSIIENARNRLNQAASQKSITLSAPKHTKAIVHGDAAGLTEALVTLVDNAIKFSPSGSTVKISSHQKDNSVYITVSDSGPGISPEAQKHMFDRFYQASASRTKQSSAGFGLGLAIAKGIIDAHGGSIAVKSSEKGSSFSLILPIVQA